MTWLAIFSPGHLLDWWVERAFVLLVILFGISTTLFFGVPRQMGKYKVGALFLMLFMVQSIYLLTYLFSVVATNMDTGVRDYFELPRFLIWICFFCLLVSGYSLRLRNCFELAVKVSLIYSTIVAISLWAKVPSLLPFFGEYLYADTKTVIEGNWIRLAAPFENPNFLAYYLVMCLVYFLFFARTTLRHLWLFLILALLYFTGSRSGWFVGALVWITLVISLPYRGLRKHEMRVVIGAFLSTIILAGILWSYVDDIAASSRVTMTLRAMEQGGLTHDPNFQGRIDMIESTIAYFVDRPLLGWGAGKYGVMDVVDNQFGIWLLRNGLIGTLLIMVSLTMYFVCQLQSTRDRHYKTGLTAFWGSVFLMLQTGAFLDNFRLGFLFFLFTISISLSMKDRAPSRRLLSRIHRAAEQC